MNWSVARQHVRIKPHVGCAARVGVIGKADELCALREAEINQGLDGCAADFGAEDNDQPLLGLYFLAQIIQRLARQLRRKNGVGSGIVAAEELYEAGLRCGRDLSERGSLMAQL